MSRPVLRTALTAVVSVVTGLAAMLATLTVSAPAQAANVATPGHFTGYGFDQCLAPTQRAMNAWLHHSPFLAVGIYISGDSRGCRHQPNLSRNWVATQLRSGWRLLPITLGPQASCSPHFPRYGNDETINPRPGRANDYAAARVQGRAEAGKAVRAARALGISARSTLWYDIEGFDHTRLRCRESALAFLSGWTFRLHRLNYVSGVYSSVGSGIKILDDARVKRPGKFHLPDRIWLARWDGKANTSSSYIRDDGWRPGGRVKQYQGGHNETWGGVTINIDRNFLDVGKGFWARPESHCQGTPVSFSQYPPITSTTVNAELVTALQCLLQERDLYGGRLHGRYTERLAAGIRAWREQRGFAVNGNWGRRQWTSLLSAGRGPILKYGSAGGDVRRVQRALNAASPTAELRANGLFKGSTKSAVRAYQRKVGVGANGIVGPTTWRALRTGRR